MPEHFYYVLLAVPKGSPEEEPSINKYAPVIAQAGSLNELKEELAKWHKETCHKTSWELRE